MSSIDDQKPSFTAIEAVKLIEGASGDPNSIEVLKQLIEVMMQSYELALDYYRSGFENCTDKMGFPERLTYLGDHNPVSEKPAVAFSMSKVEECWKRRPKLSVEALRSSKMEQLEPWSKALVTFVEMEHWLSTENSAFDVQTFERVELHRWLMAKGIASNYVFSEGKDLSAASVGSGLQANSRKALTTAQIARVFDGIGWSAEAWRKPLGDKPKWLRGCVVVPGAQGARQTLWDPVLIASHLVSKKSFTAKTLRSRFQTKTELQGWLEEWVAFEADNFPEKSAF